MRSRTEPSSKARDIINHSCDTRAPLFSEDLLENLTECYRILDLAPGSSLDQVKASYRELVKVWHPDRFAHDPKLQAKAQEKLKQINAAYERLCKEGTHTHRPSSAYSSPPPSNQHSGPTSSAGSSGRPSGQQQRPAPSPPPHQQPKSPLETIWSSRIVQIAIAVGSIALIRGLFTSGDGSRRQPTNSAPTNNQTSQSPQAASPQVAQSQPVARERVTIDKIILLRKEVMKQRPDLKMTVQEFSRYAQTNAPTYDFSAGFDYVPPEEVPQQSPPEAISAQPPGIVQSVLAKPELPAVPTGQSATAKESPETPVARTAKQEAPILPQSESPLWRQRERQFFTVGSTKDEVLAAQGSPTKFTDTVFVYDYSKVYFTNGRVTELRVPNRQVCRQRTRPWFFYLTAPLPRSQRLDQPV